MTTIRQIVERAKRSTGQNLSEIARAVGYTSDNGLYYAMRANSMRPEKQEKLEALAGRSVTTLEPQAPPAPPAPIERHAPQALVLVRCAPDRVPALRAILSMAHYEFQEVEHG